MKKAELERRIVGLEVKVTLLAHLLENPSARIKTSKKMKEWGLEWIPIIERPPAEGCRYLITVDTGTVYGAFWDGKEFRPASDSLSTYHGVTHWAELPAVPDKPK